MSSRRTFLKSSSIALAGSFAGVRQAQADDTLAATGAPCEPLPPSIQALTSMRGEMRPIVAEERRARIDKARRLMSAQDIGAVVITGGTSMRYFTGMEWGISERLLAVVLPASGTPFLVTPAFERDRAMEQVKRGPLDSATEVLTWEEHEDPYALLGVGLRARGLATGNLGAEETMRFVFADGLALALPALRVVSATPVTAGCRTIKDAHEIELMRLASSVTLKAYEAAYRALAEGMTQDRFRELVAAAHAKLGFTGGAGVQVGEFSALPHGSATPQVVKEGSILLIDGGCSVDGYVSDISRTFVLGKPTEKMKRVFAIERRAQDAALAAAKPGIPCEDVDAAARKVIVDAGYGPDYKFFTHRVGHGMGMDGHEWPYLVRGNKLPLRPGMTFSDEPGIYIPGEFGVRLEDDMVITETGAELFTPQSESLEKPF